MMMATSSGTPTQVSSAAMSATSTALARPYVAIAGPRAGGGGSSWVRRGGGAAVTARDYGRR